MTIAAGLLTSSGILLGADTEYTDGFTKQNRTKLFNLSPKTIEFRVIIAAAGNEPNARRAVQDIRESLKTAIKDLDLDFQRLKGLFDTSIGKIWGLHVTPEESTQFQLLIAVWLNGQAPARLLASATTGTYEIETFKCIGRGSYFGDYFVDRAYAVASDTHSLLLLLVRALRACKGYVDGCGGPLESYFLSNAGTVVKVDPRYLTIAENQIASLEGVSDQLLLAVTNVAMSDEDFQKRIAFLTKHMQFTRAIWSSNWQANADFTNKLDKAIKEGELAQQPD